MRGKESRDEIIPPGTRHCLFDSESEQVRKYRASAENGASNEIFVRIIMGV
jgi:hypothetical protein